MHVTTLQGQYSNLNPIINQPAPGLPKPYFDAFGCLIHFVTQFLVDS